MSRVPPSDTSIGEDFPKALEYAREMLSEYEKIPTGAFGALFIRKSIEEAEMAQAEGDIARIVRAYRALNEIS